MIYPKVIDISHYQPGHMDFHLAQSHGLRGVIHKCTESDTLVDKLYPIRKKEVAAAGLLWGAYHFLRPGVAMSLQARLFVDHAEPDAHTLMAPDHETAGVTVDNLVEFIQHVEALIHRKVTLYTGFLIREQAISAHNATFLAARQLWLADYRLTPICPHPWKEIWLWQYSDGRAGHTPHSFAGISGQTDMNSIDRDDATLAKEWPGEAI
jgi:lysozyme